MYVHEASFAGVLSLTFRGIPMPHQAGTTAGQDLVEHSILTSSSLLRSLCRLLSREKQIPYLILHLSYNGLAFGQNLLLSRWVDKLEADADDTPAMWLYIGISFAVIVAVFARSAAVGI